MQAAIRFLQIVRRRGSPPSSTDYLTFGGETLAFGGIPLTFQPA